MGKHAQLVIGPAGSGKSTYCDAIQKHCEASRRTVHVMNLDPAAEHFQYKCGIDIRDLISLDDVMQELKYGPNGGLIFCMEYLVENMGWLAEQVADYSDDYLIIDCPGQIELYSHLPVMKTVCKNLQQWGYNVCAVYCIDSLVVTDATRFIAGTLMCLSAMIQLELPHVNVLTKCDLIEDPHLLDDFFDPDVTTLIARLNSETRGRYRRLNEAMGTLIEDFSMVSFLPLDVTKEDSIDMVLSTVDHAIQYGEDVEPREPKEREDVDEEDEDNNRDDEDGDAHDTMGRKASSADHDEVDGDDLDERGAFGGTHQRNESGSSRSRLKTADDDANEQDDDRG